MSTRAIFMSSEPCALARRSQLPRCASCDILPRIRIFTLSGRTFTANLWLHTDGSHQDMAPKSRRSKSSAADSRPTTAGKTKDGSVQWPALSPMIPASDLTLTAVLPNQIYTVHNLWPSSLCKSYVSFLATLPLTTTPREAKKGNAVRVNDRFQVDDPAFAEALWSQTALRTLVEGEMEDGNGGALSDEAKRKVWGGDVLGLNANIRICV